MAYEVVMSYHLHMPSYFLGTFTEYPILICQKIGAISQSSPYTSNPDRYSFVSTRVNSVSCITNLCFK